MLYFSAAAPLRLGKMPVSWLNLLIVCVLYHLCGPMRPSVCLYINIGIKYFLNILSKNLQDEKKGLPLQPRLRKTVGSLQ